MLPHHRLHALTKEVTVRLQNILRGVGSLAAVAALVYFAMAVDPSNASTVYAGGQICLDGISQGTIMKSTDSGSTWNSSAEFSGPRAPPMNAWEKYAQVLLESNEFAFVD